MEVSLAESVNDLLNILQLQSGNLPKNLSQEQLAKDGFVTVQHNLALLTANESKAKELNCPLRRQTCRLLPCHARKLQEHHSGAGSNV